jgi:hypothetical protein
MSFKILWTDTNDYTMVTYKTVEEAIDFGKCVSNDFKVVDSVTGDLMSHYIDYGYSDHGFMNVSGMTYEQVRRMGRE